MLGHYNRLCHIITHNMCKMWGLIYSHAMKIVPTSCHMLLHVQRHHAHITWCAHAGKLAALIIRGTPGITYGCAVRARRTIFIKFNCLTFWHPKYEICKPEHAGKDSHCHAQ